MGRIPSLSLLLYPPLGMSRDSSVCIPSLYLTSPLPAFHHSLVHILLLCVFFSGIPTEAIISLMSVNLIPSYKHRKYE